MLSVGMEMAGVEAEQLRRVMRVAEIELVRADGVALAADAEELALDGVEVVCRAERLLEDRVERFGQPLARADAIDRRVLHAVGNPDVGDAGRAERLAHRGADSRGRRCQCSIQNCRMPLSAVREREAVGGLRVREAGRVEIEADAVAFGPVDPVREMFGLDVVAIDVLAAELAVAGVQIEAMRAGDERERLLEVGAQFVRRARLAGIIAGDREAAAEAACRTSRSRRRRRPASSGARSARQRVASAPRRCPPSFGVAIPGNRVGAVDPSGHHHYLSR